MANNSYQLKFRRVAVSAALLSVMSSPLWAASVPSLTSAQIAGLDGGGKANVDLEWSTAAAENGGEVLYQVGVNKVGASSFAPLSGVSGTSLTVTDLDPATSYRFAVRTLEGGLESDWSEAVTLVTDSDLDSDGLLTSQECPNYPDSCPDTDGDGTPNYNDSDDDNDGISTRAEGDGDQDSDTIPDYLEPNNIDTDNDGFANHLDADDEGDSILTVDEVGDVLSPTDSDNDGIYDYLDFATAGVNDSDSDGLTDSQECNQAPFCTNDSDGDGLTDYLDETNSDPDKDGLLTSEECPGTDTTSCPDTDGDGTPNYADEDDDGDGVLTKNEYRDSDGNLLDTDGDTVPDYLEPSNIDTDNDGLDNYRDADDEGDGIDTASEVGASVVIPTDSDGDGIPDYLDKETVATALNDADSDGVPDINDADGDGVADTDECNQIPFCTVDSDGDGLTDYLDDTDDTVVPEAVEEDPAGLRTGIDGAGGGALGLGGLFALMGMGLARRRKQAVSKALPMAVVVGVALATSAGSLQAGETQWYLGMGLGKSTVDPDTSAIAGVDVKEDSSTGGKLFAGYDFTNHWTLEGFIADLGDAELTDGVDVGYELYGLSGIYHFPGSLPGWSFLAKAGVANLSNNTIAAYEQENDTQAFVGIGGEYQLDNKLSLRGEYEYFAEDADLLSLNLLVRFGDVPVPEVKVVEKRVEVKVAEPPEGDADSDGVVDSKDRCPNTPPGMKVDANGCVFDLDGDGVLNVDDQCPDTPRGMPVHANGCPKFTGVLEGVNFELDKATLTPRSKAILTKVATQLMGYPSLKVIIVGHTDSQGSDAYNNKLSLARAKSVAAFLTSQGVRGERMKYAGYGERFPRADNKTERGRALNRRVELLPIK